jgi:hypothetical protein
MVLVVCCVKPNVLSFKKLETVLRMTDSYVGIRTLMPKISAPTRISPPDADVTRAIFDLCELLVNGILKKDSPLSLVASLIDILRRANAKRKCELGWEAF